IGTPTGSPATSDWPPARTSPCTAATSVEVPPMSKERIFRNPLRPAIAAAPTSPPAGPDNTVRTGSRAADSSAVIPPPERLPPAARLHEKNPWLAKLPRRAGAISQILGALFFFAVLLGALRQSFHVALHERLQVGVHHDRARAFVFPELRQNPMRHRQRFAEFRHGRGYRRFVLRVGKREQQRNGDGICVGTPNRLPQSSQLRV